MIIFNVWVHNCTHCRGKDLQMHTIGNTHVSVNL